MSKKSATQKQPTKQRKIGFRTLILCISATFAFSMFLTRETPAESMEKQAWMQGRDFNDKSTADFSVTIDTLTDDGRVVADMIASLRDRVAATAAEAYEVIEWVKPLIAPRCRYDTYDDDGLTEAILNDMNGDTNPCPG